MPFQVKVSLEGLVDRFDDLSQWLEQRCARLFPFTFTGRPQQLDPTLGQFAFESTVEAAPVADEILSLALSQKLAFGGQEVGIAPSARRRPSRRVLSRGCPRRSP
ncbi:hypothetical protein ACGF8B_11990 [Streptomyces sp. NPDC047917]|uniref:hypothetical protein n=1 Tax=Streptomyces sp. NPDC047917 TaxID=3365491 RepID=UPI003721852E